MGDLLEEFQKSAEQYLSPSVRANMPNGLAPLLDSIDGIIDGNDALSPETLKAMGVKLSLADPNLSTQSSVITAAKSNQPVLQAFVDDKGHIDRHNLWAAAPMPGQAKSISDIVKEGKLPGTEQDWYSYIMLHENGHGRDVKQDGKMLSIFEREHFADSEAMRDYYRAYKEGIVTNTEVPYAARSIRSVMGMMETDGADQFLGAVDGSSGGHGLAILSLLPGEKGPPLNSDAMQGLAETLVGTRFAIFKEMGEAQFSDEDATKDALSTISGMTRNRQLQLDPALQAEIDARLHPFSRIPLPQLTPPATDTVGKGASNTDKDMAVINKALEKMSDAERDGFEGMYIARMDGTKIQHGAKLAQEQPELVYETAKVLLAEGKFDDSPIGKKFVEQFVDGAQRYMPDYFGVDQSDRPTSRPEIVDDLAMQYAPAAQPTHTYKQTYAQ